MSGNVRVYGVLALGVFAVSFAAIFIRLAQAEPAAIAFYRMGIAAVLMAPLAYRQRKQVMGKPLQIGALIGAGAFLALHFLFWISSLSYTSVTTSVVLATVQPVFVALASTILLREKPGPRLWLGLSLAIAGAVLIVIAGNNGGESGMIGPILALLGGIMAAGYIIVGRVVRRNMPVTFYAASVYTISAIFLGSYAIIRGIPLGGFTGSTWGSLVMLAVLPTCVGHNAFNWALEHVPAPIVSVSIMGEPVGSTILAMVILQEFPVGQEIVGGAVILLGIIIALSRKDMRRRGVGA